MTGVDRRRQALTGVDRQAQTCQRLSTPINTYPQGSAGCSVNSLGRPCTHVWWISPLPSFILVQATANRVGSGLVWPPVVSRQGLAKRLCEHEKSGSHKNSLPLNLHTAPAARAGQAAQQTGSRTDIMSRRSTPLSSLARPSSRGSSLVHGGLGKRVAGQIAEQLAARAGPTTVNAGKKARTACELMPVQAGTAATSLRFPRDQEVSQSQGARAACPRPASASAGLCQTLRQTLRLALCAQALKVSRQNALRAPCLRGAQRLPRSKHKAHGGRRGGLDRSWPPSCAYPGFADTGRKRRELHRCFFAIAT